MRRLRTLLWLSLVCLPLFPSGAEELSPCDVKVGRVVDGDTFYQPVTLFVSRSHRVHREMRFRLKNVYAPERGEPRFGEFKELLKNNIESRTVALEIHEKERDPRGGFIVTVYLCEENGERLNVNEWMRAQGATAFGKGVKEGR